VSLLFEGRLYVIIDSHTHVDEVPALGWIDPPEALLRLMDEAGIAKSVIMTYTDLPGVNPDALEYIAGVVAGYPDRLIGYARLNPIYNDAVQLLETAIVRYGFKGLKLHPVTTLAHPADAETVRLIHKAAEYNAPTLFHCGDEPMTTPLAIAETARKCPEATIILGHMGGYFHVEEAIEVAVRLPNVLLETSAMPYPSRIKEAVERIGAQRVLFASDGPGCDPSIEVQKVKLAGLTPEEEALVFETNIRRLLEGVMR
jgi:predicted TIM-barrel fold metal-dependent hydrolase